MDKNYKPVYVRGTETGERVLETLKALGGINKYNRIGSNKDCIYFISPESHIIDFVPANSLVGEYIMATAEEVKPLKPLRWEAERGGSYYVINRDLEVITQCDCRDSSDNALYNCGNYFRTETEAIEMAKKIRKILLPD